MLCASTSCRRGGGEFKVVNALIDAGATVDQARRRRGLAAGANVDLARSAGGTPLFWAAADGTPTSC